MSETLSTERIEDFDALREVEEAWLAEHLSDAIANLGYPVGCGIAPHPETMAKAARNLFNHYAMMVELARSAADAELLALRKRVGDGSANKLDRASALEAEARRLRQEEFDERPLPDFWRVGQKVRIRETKEFAFDAGAVVEIVKVRDLDVPAREYQVFWTSEDKGEKSLFWTTPDEVELVEDVLPTPKEPS